MTHRVLVVCDDHEAIEEIAVTLNSAALHVATTRDAQALSRVDPSLSAAVLHLDESSSLELLATLRAAHPDLPVVVAIPAGVADFAAAAMQGGAVDCVRFPAERERLERSVSDACAQSPSSLQSAGVRALVGHSSAIARSRRLLLRAARTDVTVLLLGESGTGKEIAARAIHAESMRSAGPFVPVNCGAIPEGLIESELFGHVAGAFTGATRERIGRFEQASGGSLFLDEVGELRLDLQVKLLRVLQDHDVQRVGSARTRAVDVRVLAASNRDLKDLVRQGKFREDLYYRLAVFPVELPPLRERGEDVIVLARHFLARYAARHQRPPRRLSEGVERALRGNAWPGNVRELENVIERAVILEDGDVLSLRSLPSDVAQGREAGAPAAAADPSGDEIRPLADEERRILQRALQRTDWNMKLAAELLQIGRATIYRKVQKYGLHPPE